MEDLFDLLGVDDSKPIEKIDILQERISKMINILKTLREEKRLLEARVAALQEELTKKEEELDRIKYQREEIEKVQGGLNSFSEERGLIKTKIEGILRELEAVELS